MLYMLLWHTFWGSLVGQYAGLSKNKEKEKKFQVGLNDI